MERTRGSARSLWPARALSPTPARPMCGGADRNGPPWDAGARATSRARRVLAKGVLRHRPRPRSHLSRKAVGAVDSRGGRALRAVWMNHGARFIGAIRLSVSGSGPRPGNAEVWSMFHVEHTPGILPPASRFPLGSRTLVPVPDPVLMAPTANEFAGRRAGRCARPALAPCPLEGWVRVVCVRVSRRAPVGRVATIDLSVPGGELGAAGAARAEAVPSPTPAWVPLGSGDWARGGYGTHPGSGDRLSCRPRSGPIASGALATGRRWSETCGGSAPRRETTMPRSAMAPSPRGRGSAPGTGRGFTWRPRLPRRSWADVSGSSRAAPRVPSPLGSRSPSGLPLERRVVTGSGAGGSPTSAWWRARCWVRPIFRQTP